jgi:microcystin-dependent protein
MADPFIGEIRIFAGNFAPVSWAFCNGQMLSIAQYDALFTLIGTTYGGDGETTFALPDLRGRIPVHAANVVQLGEAAGMEQFTLGPTHVPAHTHELHASSSAANAGIPTGNVVADVTLAGPLLYGAVASDATMSAAAIEPVGLSQPHENRMPFLTMSYIICLEGIYPSRN